MPELPEVETTCRGVSPHLLGQVISNVEIRNPHLRWPVPDALVAGLTGLPVDRVERRAKYLLLSNAQGTAIVHLGMSGSLRVETQPGEPRIHDHVILTLQNGIRLLFNDPRRFGCWLWTTTPGTHPLLVSLGPEPLGPGFDGEHLFNKSRGKRSPVKSFIMDNHVVVGVGNIYASESLFLAGIDPRRAAGRISRPRYDRLAEAVKDVLARSIQQGGTTLRDFINADGNPGYFRQTLTVYERAGQPCRRCGTTVKQVRTGQRSTYFCPGCQR